MQTTPKRLVETPYELTFETRPEFLYARIAAPTISRSIKLDYLAEILLKCAQSRCRHILIDRHIPVLVDDEELEETIEDIVLVSENVVIAFVNPHPEIEEKLKRFVEDGKKRGGSFDYFNSRETAEKWLLERFETD